jgi:hypothetical protein
VVPALRCLPGGRSDPKTQFSCSSCRPRWCKPR